MAKFLRVTSKFNPNNPVGAGLTQPIPHKADLREQHNAALQAFLRRGGKIDTSGLPLYDR